MIQSFNQIRLTNNIVNASGGNLTVGGQVVVYQSQTGNFITTSQTGAFGGGSTPTGNLTGVFYPLTGNPSNFISSSQTGAFASIISLAATGTTLQSEINAINTFSGNFVTNNQTGIFATSLNLAATGTTLQGEINSINLFTGNFVTISQTGNFVSSTSFITFTGNIQNFITGISPTGSDNYFIQFPHNFSSIPKIQTTLEVATNIIYGTAITNKSISGFTILFSDYIGETGVVLDVYATINS